MDRLSSTSIDNLFSLFDQLESLIDVAMNVNSDDLNSKTSFNYLLVMSNLVQEMRRVIVQQAQPGPVFENHL